MSIATPQESADKHLSPVKQAVEHSKSSKWVSPFRQPKQPSTKSASTGATKAPAASSNVSSSATKGASSALTSKTQGVLDQVKSKSDHSDTDGSKAASSAILKSQAQASEKKVASKSEDATTAATTASGEAAKKPTKQVLDHVIDLGGGLKMPQSAIDKIARERLAGHFKEIDERAKEQLELAALKEKKQNELEALKDQKKLNSKFAKFKKKLDLDKKVFADSHEKKVAAVESSITDVENNISDFHKKTHDDIEKANADHDVNTVEADKKLVEDKARTAQEAIDLEKKHKEDIRTSSLGQKKESIGLRVLEAKKSEYALQLELYELQLTQSERESSIKRATHEEYTAKHNGLLSKIDEIKQVIAENDTLIAEAQSGHEATLKQLENNKTELENTKDEVSQLEEELAKAEAATKDRATRLSDAQEQRKKWEIEQAAIAQKKKEEEEALAAKREQERKAKEAEEAERKAKEAEEAERKAKEAEEAERKAKEAEEAERKAVEAEEKAKQEEEARKIAPVPVAVPVSKSAKTPVATAAVPTAPTAQSKNAAAPTPKKEKRKSGFFGLFSSKNDKKPQQQPKKTSNGASPVKKAPGKISGAGVLAGAATGLAAGAAVDGIAASGSAVGATGSAISKSVATPTAKAPASTSNATDATTGATGKDLPYAEVASSIEQRSLGQITEADIKNITDKDDFQTDIVKSAEGSTVVKVHATDPNVVLEEITLEEAQKEDNVLAIVVPDGEDKVEFEPQFKKQEKLLAENHKTREVEPVAAISIPEPSTSTTGPAESTLPTPPQTATTSAIEGNKDISTPTTAPTLIPVGTAETEPLESDVVPGLEFEDSTSTRAPPKAVQDIAAAKPPHVISTSHAKDVTSPTIATQDSNTGTATPIASLETTATAIFGAGVGAAAVGGLAGTSSELEEKQFDSAASFQTLDPKKHKKTPSGNSVTLTEIEDSSLVKDVKPVTTHKNHPEAELTVTALNGPVHGVAPKEVEPQQSEEVTDTAGVSEDSGAALTATAITTSVVAVSSEVSKTPKVHADSDGLTVGDTLKSNDTFQVPEEDEEFEYYERFVYEKSQA
ncbi:hypothetical protein WICPIJ_006152 [Wickerhamomyces pijperi]|uniref:Uncharacterized protein n=1 Tax=Wickerhamomyces pijperi TaxID=599730 RepID=A0A9P8Q4J0_WICPI|nr:hypothetical protein WICPIJ_006152 [Wickerhamomyces pijperi]